MRTAARVDANQADIVDTLRRVGARVQPLHQVGHGCADILVLFRGELYAIEIKTEHGTLTTDEERWHQQWQCPYVGVVTSADEALRLVGAID